MPLYDRLIGFDDAGNPVDNKIGVHAFQSTAAEWARGKLTQAQANAIVTAMTGVGLSASEQSEAQTLVNTVTSIPITGSATAIADGRARRALRVQEIDQVLLLADIRAPGYDTPTAVKAKLGV